jgi:hypothetical protein
MEKDLGMTVSKKDLGYDPLYPGEGIKLPPVILASLGNDPSKKTVSKQLNPATSEKLARYGDGQVIAGQISVFKCSGSTYTCIYRGIEIKFSPFYYPLLLLGAEVIICDFDKHFLSDSYCIYSFFSIIDEKHAIQQPKA